MVIKLKDPARWFKLPDGNVVALEGQGVRPVRFEVNCVTETAFHVRYPDDAVVFLATVKGLEVIEFVADGPVEVWVTADDEVFFYTDDGRNVAYVPDGEVNFAVPHERRGETEEIIYMQALMLKNQQRMIARQKAAIAAMEAENANTGGNGPGTVPPGTGAASGDASANSGTAGVAEPPASGTRVPAPPGEVSGSAGTAP